MKKLRAVTAAVLAFATTLSIAGCSNFKVIDDEDVFFDALDEAVGIDDDETYHWKKTEVNGDDVEYIIYAQDGDNFYTYIRFEEADDAMDFFEEAYDDFEDVIKDKDFEGSHSMSMNKTRGMILFDGDLDDNSEIMLYSRSLYNYDDLEIYGGVYVNQNVYIEVFTVNGSKRDREKVDMFLKEIGFPKP